MRKRAVDTSKVTGYKLPWIIGLDKDGVLVIVIDLLKMLYETVGISAGTTTTNAGVDDNMHIFSLQCNNAQAYFYFC